MVDVANGLPWLRAHFITIGVLLEVTFALIPYLFARALNKGETARLGGNWLSLAAIHAGGVAYAVSLFMGVQTGLLQAIAFTLWAISMLPSLRALWRMVAYEMQGRSAAHTAV